MSRAETFEAKAEAAERLAKDVPIFRQVYAELAKVWRRMARQVSELEPGK